MVYQGGNFVGYYDVTQDTTCLMVETAIGGQRFSYIPASN